LRQALLDLLSETLILMLGRCNDASLVNALAMHALNLPDLIARFTPDLLRYYWETERPCFLRGLPPGNEEAERFAPMWAIIGHEYRRLCPPKL
jgi:hypothetical protein